MILLFSSLIIQSNLLNETKIILCTPSQSGKLVFVVRPFPISHPHMTEWQSAGVSALFHHRLLACPLAKKASHRNNGHLVTPSISDFAHTHFCTFWRIALHIFAHCVAQSQTQESRWARFWQKCSNSLLLPISLFTALVANRWSHPETRGEGQVSIF